MIRVVLDANVLVSGLISAKGAPGKIINAWLKGQFHLCISPQIMEELTRVLKYPRIDHFQEAGSKYKGVEIISPRGFLNIISLN